ncbi:hypothetical protein D7V86_08480 [bacterium D16-51]|nr:hypothetical protein D7V86_08480 [bacterium D16-51]
MWLTIARLLLFFVSSIGYWEVFRRKTKITLYFLPAFTVSCQVTALFVAGLLNCLAEAAFWLFVTGMLLAVFYGMGDFWKHSRAKGDALAFFWGYCNVGYLYFFAALGIVLLAVRGRIFVHYDNFSHWALVVRNMLQSDRYPNFRDTLVTFQEYPLGSASFIYYFSKAVSRAENIQMLAQAYMMISFLLPVFKYVRKQKWAALAYMVLFTNYIFCYNTGINDLLVDTLLPLQGAALLLFLYSECQLYGKAADGGVSVLYAIPFFCMAMQVKNSGIYFVAAGCILVFYRCFKAKGQGAWKYLVTAAAPFFSLYFWKAHCSYVFAGADVSKHAMTAENYGQVYSEKSAGDIRLIVQKMFHFFVSGKDLYCLAGFLVFAGTVIFFLGKGVWKKYACFLGASVFLYLTYMAGMLFMYLFSMPGGEAEMLAGSDRYRKTIFIAIYYFASVMVLQYIPDIGKNYRGGGIQRRCGAFACHPLEDAVWTVYNHFCAV